MAVDSILAAVEYIIFIPSFLCASVSPWRIVWKFAFL